MGGCRNLTTTSAEIKVNDDNHIKYKYLPIGHKTFM